MVLQPYPAFIFPYFFKTPDSSFARTWAGPVFLLTEGLVCAYVPSHNK